MPLPRKTTPGLDGSGGLVWVLERRSTERSGIRAGGRWAEAGGRTPARRLRGVEGLLDRLRAVRLPVRHGAERGDVEHRPPRPLGIDGLPEGEVRAVREVLAPRLVLGVDALLGLLGPLDGMLRLRGLSAKEPPEKLPEPLPEPWERREFSSELRFRA